MKARVDRPAIIVVREDREIALGQADAAAETNAQALVPAEWPDDTPMDAVSDIPLGQPPKPPGPRNDLRETVPGD